MDLEQQSWLNLAQQPYPVVREFIKQISSFNDETEIPLLIKHWLKKYHCKVDKTRLNTSLNWLSKREHMLLTYPEYPESLKTIKDPPAVLFLAGDPRLLYLPQLAIVGSRKPSNTGRENAHYFSNNLARAGLTIISGMASGIDGLAHRAALAADGYTIAVLGCGHNTCYPNIHRNLFNEIGTKGLLISEFTPEVSVKAHQFPRRNRIISALSLGVLVVEAAVKSGSLVTCKHAAEQGREVFAIPGDITNPMSRGCHHLIRQGACLVDKPEQILDELDWNNNNLHNISRPNPLIGVENTIALVDTQLQLIA